MNTHRRRAWALRTGMVAALAAAAVTGTTAPALADDPDVQVTAPGGATLASNQPVNLQFSVRNNNQRSTNFAVQVDTSGSLACQGQCSVTEQIRGGDTETFQMTLLAATVGPGQSQPGQVRVTARSLEDGGDSETATRDFTVQAAGQPPQQVETVKKISGQIIDVATGDPIAGAIVAMQDSKNRTFSTEANDNGKFTFNGSAQRPIAPGRIDIAVGKTGFTDIRKTFELRANQSKTDIRIPLTSTASPTPTPEAEESAPAAADSAPPSLGAEDVAAQPTSGEDSGGALSWALILGGGLLVALGVGALVLLLVRRRQDKRDGPGDGAAVPGGSPGGPPGGRGAYAGAEDATRMVSPAGMGAGGTMAGRPGLADAPTMLQAPVRDEYADPYGVPASHPAPGYGTATQPAWAGNGYADATQVGGFPGGPPTAAGSPVGYGATRGGVPSVPPAPSNGYGPAGPGGPPTQFGGPPSRFETPAPQYDAPAPQYDTPQYDAPQYDAPPYEPRTGGYGGPSGSAGPGGPGAAGYSTPPGHGAMPSPAGYGPEGPAGPYGSPAAPYGSPAAPRQGYGGPDTGAMGVGAAGGGAAAGARGGYGRDRDYGDRFDEPTGRFTGEPGPAYDRSAAGYGPPGGGAGPYESYAGGEPFGGPPPGLPPSAPAGPPPGYDQRGGYEGRRFEEQRYDEPPRYDEPRYEDQRGGYAEQRRGYEPPAGYERRGGYEEPERGGQQRHEPSNGYDRPAGGYDPRASSYDQRGGYDGGGYGRDGGYEPRGYDRGHPDEQSGREPGPPPSRHAAPPQGPGERRPLDWMDD